MFLQTLNLGVTAVLISHVGGSWESTQNMTAWAGWLVLTSVSEALLLCCFGLPQNWGINFKMFWKTKPKTQVIHIWAEVNDFPLWWKDKQSNYMILSGLDQSYLISNQGEQQWSVMCHIHIQHIMIKHLLFVLPLEKPSCISHQRGLFDSIITRILGFFTQAVRW